MSETTKKTIRAKKVKEEPKPLPEKDERAKAFEKAITERAIKELGGGEAAQEWVKKHLIVM